MQQLKDVVTDAWTAAWDSGHVDALDSLLAPDYFRESANSGTRIDREQYKADILEIRSAFPDLSTTIDSIVVDADTIAVFWSTTGTFTAPLGEVPPTGTRVRTHGSNVGRLDGNTILSERVTWDQSALLRDVGIPSLASAFEKPAGHIVVEDLSGDPHREALKGFNRQFITGVTVVTTLDAEGTPRGLAANSYASVSLEPPLVLLCVQKTSSTYPALFGASHLGINIMGLGQRDTLATFASKGSDKFAGLDWHGGPHGSPLIAGSAASIEAEIKERFQARTHTVFIAKVVHSELTDADPIIYRAGKFFSSEQLPPL